MREIIFHKIRVDIREFCDVCGVEITSKNTSMMITDKCGNCKEIERGY